MHSKYPPVQMLVPLFQNNAGYPPVYTTDISFKYQAHCVLCELSLTLSLDFWGMFIALLYDYILLAKLQGHSTH